MRPLAASIDRILVVDDDELTRESLAAFLTRHGYQVSTARDGLEAVEIADQVPPTMVIADVRMPRRDGLAMVRDLRERAEFSDLPIVLYSALLEPDDRIGGLDHGADDYISKQMAPEELLARVRVQLRHAHQKQELQRRTFIDPLTGLLDRRGLMQVLQHEHERVDRTPGIDLSVLLIDVDRFKALNDSRGHLAGDQVLRDIAAWLTDTVRAVDHVARIGGDEFVVVLPDGSHAAATALAARLARLRTGEPALSVELSVGVATLVPGETIEELLARADSEMYERKRQRVASRKASIR